MRRAFQIGAILCGVVLLETCSMRSPSLPEPDHTAQIIAENVTVLDGTVVLVRFNPPPAYAVWRSEIEQCSGLTNEDPVTFWIAPVSVLNVKGALGMYVRPSHRILLGLGNETVDWIVRHEIFHHLINKDGHPDEYFKGKCAGLVWPSRS